jgi:hypothetical protein
MDEQQVLEEAYGFLRGHTAGDLRFDEHMRRLRYVIGPDGRLAAPVMYAMLSAVDVVLFVPENAEGAMELQLTLTRLDPDGPDGALADRWRIYHGEPQDIHWAVLDIDAARYQRWVLDGPALIRANPLAAHEAKLCRRINQELRQDFACACRNCGVDAENPLLVGVDPLGFDVRRMFEVVRLPAPQPMDSPEAVDRVLRAMMAVRTP